MPAGAIPGPAGPKPHLMPFVEAGNVGGRSLLPGLLLFLQERSLQERRMLIPRPRPQSAGKEYQMPPAVLTWLDYSEADQRRAREIVAMFSQRESRDELGLGRIRDALSDTLFPGTSVLLTRARYFLFIPWLYREGGRRGYTGQRLASRVEYWERSLISALREGGDHEGLIGRNVGEAVQNLPSSIYWISLRRIGILRQEGTPAQTVGLSPGLPPPGRCNRVPAFPRFGMVAISPGASGMTSSTLPAAILRSHGTRRPGSPSGLSMRPPGPCSSSWSPGGAGVRSGPSMPGRTPTRRRCAGKRSRVAG